ncbi:MAG TPA: AraC family transcriptional regulator [Tepidisphaeraceae bacterium]|nr:AraC family transcriptional regulator [Tepidisphaeraceae bacterium]
MTSHERQPTGPSSQQGRPTDAVADFVPPDRSHELVDESYRMVDYTWFRIRNRLPELATPHYLGHGFATSSHYNIRSVWQEPAVRRCPVVKIALSTGGVVAPRNGTQLRRVQPGEAILRFVEEPDLWESYDGRQSQPWEFLGLIINGELAAHAARALIRGYGHLYDLGLQHPIVRQLQQVAREPNHVREISASAAGRLCADLFGALHASAEASLVGRTEQINNLAERVEATMRGDLRHEWSVDELAARHDVSREHLTRIFTRSYGTPPHRYLVELRVREACELLRGSREPVKSIAYSLGFRSHANFIRIFKRYNGVPPTVYRTRRGVRNSADVI